MGGPLSRGILLSRLDPNRGEFFMFGPLSRCLTSFGP